MSWADVLRLIRVATFDSDAGMSETSNGDLVHQTYSRSADISRHRTMQSLGGACDDVPCVLTEIF
jgi:hypothetical protein